LRAGEECLREAAEETACIVNHTNYGTVQKY